MRRAQIGDAGELARAIEMSLPELRAFMPWSHFSERNTASAQAERLAGAVIDWDNKADYLFHIYHSMPGAVDRFVGCLGLHPRCAHNRGLEIGYWIRSDITGQGVCTLATQMLVLAGFKVMQLERVQIGCDDRNLASKRVIEKVGFVHEGLLRNHAHGVAPPHIVAQGWRGTGDIATYSLIPSDLERLTWVDSISRHLILTSGGETMMLGSDLDA